MPPKKKGVGGGQGGNEWGKEDDEIQAIVIADSFNRNFPPITYETPRALLPLGNKVIIDYTLEYLIEQGIQEIIVFCCSLAEKIRDYILKNWCSTSKCNIHCVMSSTEDCLCLGDAMRELDREGLIRSDFILVHGDLISNVKLADAIKEHKERRKKEKNLVLTMLHRKVNPGHVSRSVNDNFFMILEKETNRILFHQKSHACNKLVFPTNLLANRKEINIHYDLVDCNVYICSPHLALLFTDNFDYQTLDDFVKGILINEEILGDQIQSNIITKGYSSRVHDLSMYNIITLDLLNRWIYPLVPDNPNTYKRNNVYVEKDVTIELDCNITDGVMIGKGSSIGNNTNISKCVLGANCKIGQNVEIKNSYIWDNCVIEDGAKIVQSLVCSNAVVKRNACVTDSIISYGVVLGEEVKLPPKTRVSLLKADGISEQLANMSLNNGQENGNEDYDFDTLGADGKGYIWPLDDDEEETVPTLIMTHESSSDESSDEEEEESLPPSPPNEFSGIEEFHIEVLENLRSGIAENIAADNIALEINASKFKYNVSIVELIQTVVKAVLELALTDEDMPKQQLVKHLDKIIISLKGLLQKYFSNVEEQIHGVTAAADFFIAQPDISGIFATFLHKMYDLDLIEEHVILKWYNSIQDEYKQLRDNPNLQKLITWLEEAEEEEDSDDDDDESD